MFGCGFIDVAGPTADDEEDEEDEERDCPNCPYTASQLV
jgi:hypothetical protein